MGRRMGSSPHTWRTLAGIMNGVMTVRIISTYVENTFEIIKGLPQTSGSSPHTWRTH